MPIREGFSGTEASPAAEYAAATAARAQRQHMRSHGAAASMAAGALAGLQLPAPSEIRVRVAEEGSAQGALPLQPASLRPTGMHMQQTCESSSGAQHSALDAPQIESSAEAEAAHGVRRSESEGQWQGQELELVDCSPGYRAEVLPTAPLTSSDWQRPSSSADGVFPPVTPGTFHHHTWYAPGPYHFGPLRHLTHSYFCR